MNTIHRPSLDSPEFSPIRKQSRQRPNNNPAPPQVGTTGSRTAAARSEKKRRRNFPLLRRPGSRTRATRFENQSYSRNTNPPPTTQTPAQPNAPTPPIPAPTARQPHPHPSARRCAKCRWVVVRIYAKNPSNLFQYGTEQIKPPRTPRSPSHSRLIPVLLGVLRALAAQFN